MTHEIRAKLKALVNSNGVFASDVANYVLQLERENKTILNDNDELNNWVTELNKKLESDELALKEASEIIAELKAKNKQLETEINKLNEKIKAI